MGSAPIAQATTGPSFTSSLPAPATGASFNSSPASQATGGTSSYNPTQASAPSAGAAAGQTTSPTTGFSSSPQSGAAAPSLNMNSAYNYAPEDENGAAAVGVPDSSNFYLPKLSDYGQPFFEQQGLRFRIGPVHLNISLSLATEYNDNIYASHTDPVAAMVERAAPFFVLGMGDFRDKNEDYLLLDYRPSYDYYLGSSAANRLNQTLEGSGRATFSRYTTSAILSYVNSNEPNATQTNRTNYQLLNFNWDNSYYLTAKTFSRLTLTAQDQDYESGDRYTTYSANPLLGYDFSPKTTVFFGPYAGIAYTEGSSGAGSSGTQTFQGVSAGVNYTNLRKLRFQGIVGMQARQFHGFNAGGASNFMTPVFDFTLTYTPREKTDLRLELVRSVQIADILQGSTYTATEVQLSLVHRLTAKVTLSLDLDYQYLEYQGMAPQGKNGTYLAFTPTASYSFWRDQCSVNIYYRGQQRTSSVETYGYSINTYGIQFIVLF